MAQRSQQKTCQNSLRGFFSIKLGDKIQGAVRMGFTALKLATFVSSFAALCVAQIDLPRDLARLVQIRERLRQNQDRIPNYTCLETITRSQRPPRSLVISRNGGPGRFLRQDIVRLEVAEVNGKEFFASPGAYNFAETDISTFVTGGMIGNGLFTLFAREVFSPSAATYQFAGESNVGGRTFLRYDYRISVLLSNYLLKCLGEAKVGYHGSFLGRPKDLRYHSPGH